MAILFLQLVSTYLPINCVVFSLDLVEDCSIAGYEDDYGDVLPYGVQQKIRTPDSTLSRYGTVGSYKTTQSVRQVLGNISRYLGTMPFIFKFLGSCLVILKYMYLNAAENLKF